MVEYCGGCKGRRLLTYRVREDIQRLVLLNRWKFGVWLASMSLAEKGGITYSFEDLKEKLERPRGAAES